MERSSQITPAAEPDPSWRGWLSYIAEASDLLAGILDEERVTALVAQLIVPRLAVWCAVYADEDAGPACVWHTDEDQIEALRDRLGELLPAPGSFLTPPADTGPIQVPWAAPLPEEAYILPLIARGRRLGLMVIGGERIPDWSIELAEELSRRAALAIDSARLYAAQTAMSRALQRSLLPYGLPDIPGVEVAVVYEPAGEGAEVGGDFYDLFPGPPGASARTTSWRFAIGDVCGTGPEAAAVTGLARHALRILAAEGMPPPDVLGRLNRLILGEGPRSRLLTLLHGEIAVNGRGVRLDLVNAGHPPPLLLSADGSIRPATTPQPLLGALDDVKYESERVLMRSGDVLLCVTDGVTERRRGDRMLGDDHGLERLLASCGGLSAGAVAARIQRAVRDYGTIPSHDDVAIIVLRAS